MSLAENNQVDPDELHWPHMYSWSLIPFTAFWSDRVRDQVLKQMEKPETNWEWRNTIDWKNLQWNYLDVPAFVKNVEVALKKKLWDDLYNKIAIVLFWSLFKWYFDFEADRKSDVDIVFLFEKELYKKYFNEFTIKFYSLLIKEIIFDELKRQLIFPDSSNFWDILVKIEWPFINIEFNYFDNFSWLDFPEPELERYWEVVFGWLADEYKKKWYCLMKNK